MACIRRWGSASLCGVLLICGCSAFQGRRVTNLAPFAENTMALVSSLRLTFPRPARPPPDPGHRLSLSHRRDRSP